MEQRYVVIIETASSNPELNLPSHYPIRCAEFATKAEAMAAYPEKVTLSAEAYSGYLTALLPFYEASLAPEKPWWAFWQQ